METQTKKCSKCKEVKGFSEFYKDRLHKHGLQSQCKVCCKMIKMIRHTNNPEEARRYSLKRNFGMTLSDYKDKLDEQNQVCAICGHQETYKRYGKVCSLAVDHCHDTGQIRGLLCQSCNTTIGKMNDDPEMLEKAAAYLRRYKGSNNVTSTT